MPSKMAVNVEMLYVHHLYSGRHLSFLKNAVYFKLNYLKLIYLQANMLSSFIFTYVAVDHTYLSQNCHSALLNTRFRT